MYLPPSFAEDDPAVLRRLVQRAGAGSLVTVVDGALFATTLPLLLDDAGGGPGRLIGHVARANPQWRRSDPNLDALVIFTGASGYVSPGLYPSKREHGRVVPTWNYEAVHASGPLVVHDDPAWVLDVVTRLTDHHEAAVADRPPWSVDDAPRDFVEGQLRAIVGIEIPIRLLVGKRKLSQNRPVADRDAVAADFGRRAAAGSARALDMARAMGEAIDGGLGD